ncbi:thioredoxin family protein [Shewanella maritima]|uniref:thioredoxin family protein n=1 Tax=Shewanella maritima TaxID=2520507 RepID=UPI0037357B6E
MHNSLKTVLASSALLLSANLISPAIAEGGCGFDEESKGFIATCSEEKQEVILTGIVTKEQLEQKSPGYAMEHGDYQADQAIIEQLKQINEPTEIVVIIGTWCPDCHRETPRFIRIMEQVANPNISFKFIGIDRTRTDPEGLAAQYDFQRIPTFIVHQKGESIGTIVERPTVSLEADLLKILRP